MREDMDKVLVESARSGRAFAPAIAGSRRKKRNAIDADGEGGPQRLSMKLDRNKHFGEHLGPLYRYLRKQVNRPWSKVYGELCANLDKRNVMQAHLFQHIHDRVEVDTLWHDDEVYVRQWRGVVPLAQSRAPMYVHPRSGILLINRVGEIERRRKKAAQWQERFGPKEERHLPHGWGSDIQWHRIDGIWYEIALGILDTSQVGPCAYDVIMKRIVDYRSRDLLSARYGAANRYASSKRQIDGRRLRAHGLASTADEH